MNKSPEIVCIGEAIVDFVSTTSGVALKDAPGFGKMAGGAPANVAVGIARLGTRSAFVGTVGDDPFGHFLIEELRKAAVDTRWVTFDKVRKTRLAFVSLTSSGDRDFQFWENHPADERVSIGNRMLRLLAEARIVHISSFMLLKNPSRSATLNVARSVARTGTLLSFDPNLRLSLWKSPAEARKVLRTMIRQTSILRLNEEEAIFLTGKKNIVQSARALRALGPSLVVVTTGERGCYFQTEGDSGVIPGFRVKAVDTTGCGDAFLAGLLHGIVERTGNFASICRFANAVGALTSLKRGAIAALPARRDVERFMKRNA